MWRSQKRAISDVLRHPTSSSVTGALTARLCLLQSADVLTRLASLVCLAATCAGCGILSPAPPARPTATSPAVAHIAFIGPDDQVYVSDSDGSAARLVSGRATAETSDDGWSYRWPT